MLQYSDYYSEIKMIYNIPIYTNNFPKQYYALTLI